jgi:hypothetical protein
LIQAEKTSADAAAVARAGAIEAPAHEPGEDAFALPGFAGLRPGSGSTERLDVDRVLTMQRLAGNRATRELLTRLRRPTSRSAPVVQRRVIPAEQTWLRGLLAARGGPLATQIAGDPAARLMGIAMGDRMDTVASVRADVDAFEVAVGGAPGFGNANAARIVSALEDSQSNADLATRLVTLFNASVDPLVGLACLVTIDLDRVRAALQADVARTRTAITRLTTRLTGVAIPANLRSSNAFITTLGGELAAPTTAGVTASNAARETRVEALLTPPAVAAARAEAIRLGRPPPAFREAGYYSDMIEALHRVATDQYRAANETNRRTPMDMSAGGRVESIAAEAKRRVDGLFGVFGSSVAPRMTVGTNLFDQSARPGDPRDMARWFVADSGDDRIVHVDEAHNAFGVDRANEIREDVIDHYSNTPAASGHAPAAGLDARLGTGAAERRRRLTLTDRMWPGMQQAGRVFITPREGRTPAQTRALYWNLFKTCVHEYLHTTANATYTTWYRRLTDPHHKITYQEGFTDWFTLKTWRSVFPEEVASNEAFRRLIQGSPDVDLAAASGDPSHYPEMAEAEQLEATIGLPNMRAAYFRGNTAVLGGGRLPHS